MTYTHLTPNELVMIEAYFHQETPVAIVAKQLKRGRQTIYNVYNFLKCGGTALEYFEQYKENKRRCGRTEIIFPAEEKKNTLKKDQLKVGPQTHSLLAVQSEPSLVQ
jgi:IS30 family transposase